jgi:hypothetical protein
MERMEFDLLFHWFVGIGVDAPAWDHSAISKNRDRLPEGKIVAKFLAGIFAQPQAKKLLSGDHFSVDGTVIEAWASMKSLKPREGSGEPPDADGCGGRNQDVDFKGEKCTNETHVSTTDSEARRFRKGAGKEAKLCFIGHSLMEIRSSLLVDARVTLISGLAERLAAIELIAPCADRPTAITLGADRNFDTADFVAEFREINVTPHMAWKTHSSIDGRATRHAGYAVSPRIRDADRGRRRLDKDDRRPR